MPGVLCPIWHQRGWKNYKRRAHFGSSKVRPRPNGGLLLLMRQTFGLRLSRNNFLIIVGSNLKDFWDSWPKSWQLDWFWWIQKACQSVSSLVTGNDNLILIFICSPLIRARLSQFGRPGSLWMFSMNVNTETIVKVFFRLYLIKTKTTSWLFHPCEMTQRHIFDLWIAGAVFFTTEFFMFLCMHSLCLFSSLCLLSNRRFLLVVLRESFRAPLYRLWSEWKFSFR